VPVSSCIEGCVYDLQRSQRSTRGLGEIDEAVQWYRKAFEDRSPDMVYAKVGSRLNPRLAANAGYRAIPDQMAFAPSAH
jgi:hypothetical protein